MYVYQLDSYRYWQDQMHRDDFTFGQFGENFTVEGLGDDDVCIGDRYRIGSALFEVTQPRVTCYRVGIRMDEPRMAALLVAHGRPGFYLRVLEEGDVQAGDDVMKIATGPEAMTVAELNALLYLAGHHDVDQLRRALRIPALSPGWQASLRALLDEALEGSAGGGNAGLTAQGPPPAWRGFRTLRVAAKRSETSDVVSLELESERRSAPAAGASPASSSPSSSASRTGLLATRAQLFALGITGRCPLPDRRQGRTARRRGPVHPRRPSASATRWRSEPHAARSSSTTASDRSCSSVRASA